MFVQYCQRINSPFRGFDNNYEVLYFDLELTDWSNPDVSKILNYFHNFMRNKWQKTEHRIMALEFLYYSFNRNNVEKTFHEHEIKIDTNAAANLMLKTLNRKRNSWFWLCYYRCLPSTKTNYFIYTIFYNIFADVVKDRAIPKLWKMLEDKKITAFWCCHQETQTCMQKRAMHSTRYCDYAAFILAKICKVKAIFKFHEDNQKDDEEIAKLKLYVKAYCAERGIKLE